VEGIEKDRLYKARHTKAERRGQWCKVEFEVKVIRYKEEFDCECGLFAHMRMLFGHALKVSKTTIKIFSRCRPVFP
jgi:hypothetical protein